MPALEDMRQFAAALPSRRNKGAILLHPALPEQRSYAARLAAAVTARHLDVLARFQEDASLMSRLATFTTDDLLALVAEQADPPLVVVSGIEFLLGVWLSQREPKQVKQELCRKAELWERQPAFVLVTHEDPVLAGYQPERFPGTRVVLHTSQTLALE